MPYRNDVLVVDALTIYVSKGVQHYKVVANICVSFLGMNSEKLVSSHQQAGEMFPFEEVIDAHLSHICRSTASTTRLVLCHTRHTPRCLYSNV